MTTALDRIRAHPDRATPDDVLALLATIDVLLEERDQARRDADAMLEKARACEQAERAAQTQLQAIREVIR